MISGTVRPSAFAVLRLMTISYLVGACTGRLAGLLARFYHEIAGVGLSRLE
jgi:hypothetical protein